jgi:hypothetical protein
VVIGDQRLTPRRREPGQLVQVRVLNGAVRLQIGPVVQRVHLMTRTPSRPSAARTMASSRSGLLTIREEHDEVGTGADVREDRIGGDIGPSHS